MTVVVRVVNVEEYFVNLCINLIFRYLQMIFFKRFCGVLLLNWP